MSPEDTASRRHARLIEKLQSPIFPRSLPSPPPGELQGNETIRIGVGGGESCSACDEEITVADDADLAREYLYSGGLQVRFHYGRWRIWEVERHKPRRRTART